MPKQIQKQVRTTKRKPLPDIDRRSPSEKTEHKN